MANLSLAETIRSLSDADKVALPIPAGVAGTTLTQLAAEPVELDRLTDLVNRDPALVCSLLRAANSSFFAGLKKTSGTTEAVTRLGLERAAQVVEQTCRLAGDCPQGELLPVYLKPIWQHSLGCAVGASWLARRCGYQALAEPAYLAGLIHDIGKLYLLATLEQIACEPEYGMTISVHLAEEIIETMHVEQGLRLVEEWSLPEVFGLVIDTHHDDDLENQDLVVALVKLANKGCRKVGLGLQTDPDLVLPTTPEAQFLGISEIALAEYEIMLEDHFGLVAPVPVAAIGVT